MDFPKKQQQCLIPKYLLDYATELQDNHPDPTAEWSGGSGGSPIEAGTGIEITGDETKTISVDSSVAMKTDIPDVSDFITENEVDTKLEDYELKSDAFSGSYNDLTDKPDLSVYAESADLGDCAYLDEDELSIAYSQITGTPTIPTKTSELTNDSGYITGVTWNDVTNKPTFATVATSGDYDDLSNKPTIPVVPTNISAFTNDSGYITSSALPTNHVTTDTNQDITAVKGFTGNKLMKFFDNASTSNKMGFTCYHSAYTEYPVSANENGYLEAQYSDRDLSSSPSMILGMYNSSNISKTRYLGFKYYSNNNGTTNRCNLVVPTNRTETTVRYIPVSVNGSFADNTGNISISIPTVVDTVADGNMNAVTSNAVYDIVGDIETLLAAL